jgi:transcriptional regulator with XRE-family HTH domain
MYVPGHSFGRIRLGDRLRAVREAAGATRLDAARAIFKRNEDTIRHFETGNRLIDPLQLDTLVRFYRCGEEVAAELQELHALASTPGDFATFGLPENIVTYLELERAASVIRTWQTAIIPGMLQIKPYMRRLFELGKVDPNAIDQRVRARLKRRERLHTPIPVQLTAVISEEALLRCAGEPDVGSVQLKHLLAVAELENVEIRIMEVSVGMHVGMSGSFTCLMFPDEVVDDFAYLETTIGNQLTDQAATVGQLNRMFNELCSQALTPSKSLALIAQLATQEK